MTRFIDEPAEACATNIHTVEYLILVAGRLHYRHCSATRDESFRWYERWLARGGAKVLRSRAIQDNPIYRKAKP